MSRPDDGAALGVYLAIDTRRASPRPRAGLVGGTARAFVHGAVRIFRAIPAAAALAVGISLVPERAEARGTFFLLELSTGIAEPAYDSGEIGLTYGLSAGMTWKFTKFPPRFHLLLSTSAKSARSSGTVDGLRFNAEHHAIEVYVAHRIAMPMWGPMRIYGEVGLGERFITSAIRREADLGRLSSSSAELLVVLAAGLQFRLTEGFSLGLRAEMTPLDRDLDLISATSRHPLTNNRGSLQAQLGIHF